MDDTLIDITPLLVRMCLEAGIRYDGAQMIVKREQWLRWQDGLLKEFLQDDEEQEGEVAQPEDSEAATFPIWQT